MKKTLLTLATGILLGGLGVYAGLKFGSTPIEMNSGHAESALYTCGMHPEVLQSEPGNCPICGMRLTPVPDTQNGSTNGEATGKILYWRAPMDPTEIYDKPGKSRMGMDLVPVREGEESGGTGSIEIDGRLQQNMNLRVAPATTRNLTRTIRAFGKVTFAEDKMVSVTSRTSGWIEKLHANTTGQPLRKGQPLYEIYSPELLSTQEEYLLAYQQLQNAQAGSTVLQNASTLLEAARKRLQLWGVSAPELRALEQRGSTTRTMLVRAPVAGVVISKHVTEGQKIAADGKPLFTIADLSEVWVEAAVYETEIPFLKTGQKAELVVDHLRGADLSGSVDFVYPYLESSTRSVKVRLKFRNTAALLKPDMFATVRIHAKIADSAMVVPTEAVLRTGTRNLVFVETQPGKFEARQIEIGLESADGFVQVLSGLLDRERVVISGQFLLDSESKTREAIAKLRASRRMTHEHSGDEGMPKRNIDIHKHDASQTMRRDSLFISTMHPEIITSDPDARCSFCEMPLVPVAGSGIEPDTEHLAFYTCPEHENFVTTHAGDRCPICLGPLEKI